MPLPEGAKSSVVSAGRGTRVLPERMTPLNRHQRAIRRREIRDGGTSGGGTLVPSGSV